MAGLRRPDRRGNRGPDRGPGRGAVASAFEEQIAALVGAGVDLLLFETFHHLGEIEIALRIGRKLFSGPIVAQMSFEEDGRLRDGSPPERVATPPPRLRAPTSSGSTAATGLRSCSTSRRR